MDLILSVLTQTLTFLPLALGIGVSYSLLKATDMTLDGSFVLGAAIFARLITLGISPTLAGFVALLAGGSAGLMVALIQRGGKVDPLLAGILASFILVSGNLIVMGRPNISLLSQTTLVSSAFSNSDLMGWSLVGVYCFFFCALTGLVLSTRFGLMLRALGDNPSLLKRLGHSVESYRMMGFALTNMLSASAGILTAQTVGYADIGMGLGMTLTGIGAIILGQQVLRIFKLTFERRIVVEFLACLIGVMIYFFAMNGLLRLDVNPIYFKMILGVILILFLRSSLRSSKGAR
jgi:putative ABC transport system permease protein